MTRYISHLMLGLSLAAFHQNAVATEAAAIAEAKCKKTLENLEKLTGEEHLPTLAEIRAVDPTKVPWGVNLDLVMKRGAQARKASADKCDFSSRITLYQKHKSKAKEFTERFVEIKKQIDEANADIANQSKLLESARIWKKSEIKKEIDNKNIALSSLHETMGEIKDKLQDNNKKMKAIGHTIMSQMKLTPTQLAKLPESESWKAMKQEAQQTIAPRRPRTPTPVKGGLSSPPNRPLPRAPQEKPNF